jgi:hypothetical protein
MQHYGVTGKTMIISFGGGKERGLCPDKQGFFALEWQEKEVNSSFQGWRRPTTERSVVSLSLF